MPNLTHNVVLPRTRGQVVEDYLKVIAQGVPYPAWTLTDSLSLQPCDGLIRSNGSWNYHNNYDDSELEMHVVVARTPDGGIRAAEVRWFTMNKEEALMVQRENIRKWRAKLTAELERLNELENPQPEIDE